MIKHYPMYYGGVKQVYPDVSPGSPIYARSVVVDNLVFLSGMTGQDMETGKLTSNVLEKQLVVALDKIRTAMEEAGSSMNNIIKTIMLLKDVKDYPRMRKAELEYYQKHAPLLVENPPASTFIQPAAMINPDCLVEVDAIGVISRDKPGQEVTFYPEYWGGKKLAHPYVEPGAPKFSRSVVTGNLVFVSGAVGRDLKTGEVTSNVIEEQMEVALDGIRRAMEEAGSSMNNVVRTFMLLPDLELYPRMRKAEVQYYQKHAPLLVEDPPHSTIVRPGALANPEYLIEIDVVGVISRDKPGQEVTFYPDYWAGKKLAYPHVALEAPKFARSVVVGNLVFVSGCEGANPETVRIETNVFEEQLLIALDSIKMALEEVGSSMNNIVKTTILLPNPKDYASMRKLELEYYQKHAPILVEQPPASIVIVEDRMPVDYDKIRASVLKTEIPVTQPPSAERPEFWIEIDVVAVVSRGK